MTNRTRIAGLLVLTMAVAGRPAFAQVDLSGEWAVKMHEDSPRHRGGALELGDYTGLPINEEARYKAESWKEAVLAEPERQCIPHVATYFMRGPANFRIWKEIDAANGQVIGINLFPAHHSYRQIWLDGRPHPPEYAKHTWAGFSTGKWEGNALVVTTTHIKWGWIQRNGVPVSDRSTMTEYFIRHENYLTVVSIVEDPVYLTEPFIRSTDWVLDTGLRIGGFYPCGPDQIADEAQGWPEGFVPHYLPGQNDQLTEFSTTHNIPPEGAKGGAETTYPEFLLKLKELVKK
jgi:hypothetical protein